MFFSVEVQGLAVDNKRGKLLVVQTTIFYGKLEGTVKQQTFYRTPDEVVSRMSALADMR